MLYKSEIGKKREQFAADYLVKEGYHIVAHNYRLRNGEVDIIAVEYPQGAEKSRVLVFFEVKNAYHRKIWKVP